MANKTSLVITSTDQSGKTFNKTYTCVNSGASAENLQAFAQGLNGLTKNTFDSAALVERTEIPSDATDRFAARTCSRAPVTIASNSKSATKQSRVRATSVSITRRSRKLTPQLRTTATATKSISPSTALTRWRLRVAGRTRSRAQTTATSTPPAELQSRRVA